MHTSTHIHGSKDTDIMSELAVYGIARDVANVEAKRTKQKGTPVFGFEEQGDSYEITTGDPYALADYGLEYTVVAPNSEFNLIVRKEDPEALHKMNPKTLREYLTKILDSV